MILAPTDYQLWLDPAFRNLVELSPMPRPFNPGVMKRYSVSMRINTPTNDDPECAAEVEVAREGPEQLLSGIHR